MKIVCILPNSLEVDVNLPFNPCIGDIIQLEDKNFYQVVSSVWRPAREKLHWESSHILYILLDYAHEDYAVEDVPF